MVLDVVKLITRRSGPDVCGFVVVQEPRKRILILIRWSLSHPPLNAADQFSTSKHFVASRQLPPPHFRSISRLTPTPVPALSPSNQPRDASRARSHRDAAQSCSASRNMEKKRKLPARGAARAEGGISKKSRTSTPPEQARAPTPPHVVEIEPLPTTISTGRPLPTVDHQQQNLPSSQYQSITERYTPSAILRLFVRTANVAA